MIDSPGVKKECLMCGEIAHIKTTDARPHKSPPVLMRRRRKCGSCGEAYTTHEVLASDEHQSSYADSQEAVFRKVLRDAGAALYHAMEAEK